MPAPRLPGQIYRPPNRKWRSQGLGGRGLARQESWGAGGGPGTHNRGDGGRPLFQLLQVQRLLGRGVGPGVAGRGEEAGPWRQEPVGETSVRPTGSRPPGSSLDDGAGGAARERRRSRITGPRRPEVMWGLLPSSLPPLVHEGPTRGQDPSHPSPEAQPGSNTPETAQGKESPRETHTQGPHHARPFGSCQKGQESTSLRLGSLGGSGRLSITQVGEAQGPG